MLLSNCEKSPVVSHSYCFLKVCGDFCCLVHRLVSRGRLLDCGLPLAAEFQRGLGRLAARSYEVSLSLLGGTGHEILQDVVDSHDAQKNTSKGTILKDFPGVGVIWYHKG